MEKVLGGLGPLHQQTGGTNGNNGCDIDVRHRDCRTRQPYICSANSNSVKLSSHTIAICPGKRWSTEGPHTCTGCRSNLHVIQSERVQSVQHHRRTTANEGQTGKFLQPPALLPHYLLLRPCRDIDHLLVSLFSPLMVVHHRILSQHTRNTCFLQWLP